MSNESNSIIKTIASGSAWSFIGVLLAAAFFYWQEYRNPFDLRIELVDEFSLVEVKEKISDLKILYKNDDILKSKKEIKVVRFVLSNKGETILQSYYDQLEPFGIRFSKSKILDAEVTSTNSGDLETKLIEKHSTGNETQHDDLLFSKVIFDQGDVATIKVTLLHPSDSKLDVIALGKIANIKDLSINRVEESEESPTSPWVYIVGGYFGLIIFMLVVAALIVLIESKTKKRKVSKYKKKHGEFSEIEKQIVDLYMDLGSRSETLISGLLKGNTVLDFKEIIDLEEKKSDFKKILFPFSYGRRIQFHSLTKEIFIVEGTKVSFNPDNEEFLKSFFSEVL